MAYQTINPYTEQFISEFPQLEDEHLTAIIASAEHTYQQDWRHRPLAARQAVLKKAAALLREQRDEFAKLATLEMGKLFSEAQGEVSLSANILDYYADNAAVFLADKPLDVSRGEAYVITAPVGVIFCIEPWNFPFYQLARVAGPNLMAGNTLIAKHSPNVPQCALAFEKLFLDAGAPKGLYTNVFISNEQAATVIADTRVRGVALTGSERAGTAVAAEAGKALKKSTMELGGSDAFIVLDDADLNNAVKAGVSGRLLNAGQVCDAAKRFILDDTIADDFLALFKSAFESIKAGDPMDPATTLAPLNSKAALELALSQIDTAVKGGATLLTGGKRMDRPGFFLEPTILTNVSPTNPVYYQEFFSPVALVFRVNNEQQAIALANDSPFGLGCALMTTDLTRGKRVASQIEAGMVFINEAGSSSPELPFGGVKNSGYGRELSDLGINEFVNKKLVRVS